MAPSTKNSRDRLATRYLPAYSLCQHADKGTGQGEKKIDSPFCGLDFSFVLSFIELPLMTAATFFPEILGFKFFYWTLTVVRCKDFFWP